MAELVPYSFEAEAWKCEMFLKMGPTLLEAAIMPITGEQDPDIDMRPVGSYRMEVGSAFLAVSVPEGHENIC